MQIWKRIFTPCIYGIFGKAGEIQLFGRILSFIGQI